MGPLLNIAPKKGTPQGQIRSIRFGPLWQFRSQRKCFCFGSKAPRDAVAKLPASLQGHIIHLLAETNVDTSGRTDGGKTRQQLQQLLGLAIQIPRLPKRGSLCNPSIMDWDWPTRPAERGLLRTSTPRETHFLIGQNKFTLFVSL